MTVKTESQDRLGIAAQVGLLAGPFLTMIDSSVVNVALPDISTSLGAQLTTVQWVLSSYLLALAVVLAATAYLARRFGTLRVYLVSLIGFTAASALCAGAGNIELLIVARVLQGALGAPLVPLAMGMLLGKGGAAQKLPAAAGMLLFLAPALGPTIGGLLIHLAGWPLIFLVNVPLGALACWGVLRMPRSAGQEADPTARFDLPGFVSLASGLALTIYGASQGPQRGWASLDCWPFLAAGILLLVSYSVWALRQRHPVLDIGLMHDGQTALAILLSILTSIVMFVMIFLMPVYMEAVQGISALVAGLTLLPQGIVTGIGTVLGSKLPEKIGVRWTSLLGMLVLTGATAALGGISATTPAWVIAAILCGRGLALGLVIQPLLLTAIGGLPERQVADGNTLFNVVQRLGGSLGIPLLATLFQNREQFHVERALRSLGISLPAGGSSNTQALSQLPTPVRDQVAAAATAGFHDVIWVLVGISAVGVCAALLIRGRLAGPSSPLSEEGEREAATTSLAARADGREGA